MTLDRFGEPATEQGPAPAPDHDQACVNGWLPPDDEARPVACGVCRPWLAACPTCGKAQNRCEFEKSMVGRCCPQCPHIPPTRKTRRTAAANNQETPK